MKNYTQINLNPLLTQGETHYVTYQHCEINQRWDSWKVPCALQRCKQLRQLWLEGNKTFLKGNKLRKTSIDLEQKKRQHMLTANKRRQISVWVMDNNYIVDNTLFTITSHVQAFSTMTHNHEMYQWGFTKNAYSGTFSVSTFKPNPCLKKCTSKGRKCDDN